MIRDSGWIWEKHDVYLVQPDPLLSTLLGLWTRFSFFSSIFSPVHCSVINKVIKVSESEDMEEAAAKIHSDDVHLCRRLGQVRDYCDHFD